MSELLGISTQRPINISFSFADLENAISLDNSSWGVGFYRRGEMNKPYAAIIKEPISARNSLFTYFLKYGYIETNLLIGNIRLASVGAKVHLNTHPFELMLDPRTATYKEKSWIFTHNGTMPEIKTDRNFRTTIQAHGNTDSEYIFCYLIEQLRHVYLRNGYVLPIDERIQVLEQHARKLTDRYPENLNFMLSDGEYLYAYYGGYEKAGGLWHASKTLGSEKVTMLDVHDGMTLQLTNVGAETNDITLIAAHPLTPHGWEQVHLKELKVLKDGQIIQ